MSARTDGAGSFAQRSMQLVETLDGREVHHSDGLFLSKAHEAVSQTGGFVTCIHIHIYIICVYIYTHYIYYIHIIYIYI